MTVEHVYRVKAVERVVDADTYWLHLDVGFRGTLLVNIRLNGYDCPERRQGSANEKQHALYATGYADAWLLRPPGDLLVHTEPDPDSLAGGSERSRLRHSAELKPTSVTTCGH